MRSYAAVMFWNTDRLQVLTAAFRIRKQNLINTDRVMTLRLPILLYQNKGILIKQIF